jgi:hypothetical protein
LAPEQEIARLPVVQSEILVANPILTNPQAPVGPEQNIRMSNSDFVHQLASLA